MSPAFWRRPAYVLGCCTFIVLISYGIRQSFGLFMAPVSLDLGWGREVFSFAIAAQNLLIGLGAPVLGAIADKRGPVRVLVGAGALYGAGLLVMSQSASPAAMFASAGMMCGLGLAGCGLPLLAAIVGRVAPDARRTLWIGIVTAGGTAGQLFIVPLSQALIVGVDWIAALAVMAVMAAMIVPLAASLGPATAGEFARKPRQSLTEALMEAGLHRGYLLLTAGFFVCGLQVQFIATHLPAYLADSGAGPALAAAAIAAIGLFNMAGTWTAGWLGGLYRMKYLLSLIYLGRALAILAFIRAPVSDASVMIFAAVMGLLWLGTVPLTSGIVARVFGTRYMATLYGIVFLSHQAGSFTGVWLGGRIYDATGSYDGFWWIAVVMGLLAALIHWPIDDRPLARPAERPL